MTKKFRKGQSVVEYTMLIIIVAAALVAMSTYMTRSMNARLIAAQTELDYYKNDDVNIASTTAPTTTPVNGARAVVNGTTTSPLPYEYWSDPTGTSNPTGNNGNWILK